MRTKPSVMARSGSSHCAAPTCLPLVTSCADLFLHKKMTRFTPAARTSGLASGRLAGSQRHRVHRISAPRTLTSERLCETQNEALYGHPLRPTRWLLAAQSRHWIGMLERESRGQSGLMQLRLLLMQHLLAGAAKFAPYFSRHRRNGHSAA